MSNPCTKSKFDEVIEIISKFPMTFYKLAKIYKTGTLRATEAFIIFSQDEILKTSIKKPTTKEDISRFFLTPLDEIDR